MSRRRKQNQADKAFKADTAVEQVEVDRRRLTTRRLARAAVGVLLAIALVGACVIFLTPEPESAVQAVVVNCPDPPPEPGPGRPWEADVPVSTYSSVNTRTRNLFTAIPIVSWSGRGPGMNMALYHNSANVDLPASRTDNVGFSLGSGWSVAYSDQLLFDDPKTRPRSPSSATTAPRTSSPGTPGSASGCGRMASTRHSRTTTDSGNYASRISPEWSSSRSRARATRG